MNRKVRLALVGLALLVIVVLAWFLLISPVRNDIASVTDSIETERDKLAAAQAKVAQAEATREEGKKNQARLLELAKMVPATEEIPSLLLQIQDLAEQSGITFISITPGDPLEAGAYRIVPLDLQFSGTYFDLSDFVWRAEQMVGGPGRLLAIKDLDMQLGNQADAGSQQGSNVSPQLSVNMTIYAFEMGSTATTTRASAPAGASSGDSLDETTSTTLSGS